MPSQKNQHFVPQVYMRPFAADEDRKTINLYTIALRKLISRAPIKHQCASSYFYGDDKILENQFGEIEGRYAEIARQIARGKLTSSSADWLQLFIALQYNRTLYAQEQVKEFLERSAAITFKGKAVPEDQKPVLTREYIIGGAFRRFVKFAPYIKDLKFCIIRNRTSDAFITSDCPVVFTNRYHIQQLRRSYFGVANSGALFVMPMSPETTICLYDRNVYSVQQTGGFVHTQKTDDVLALNELQYLNAHKNIYFSKLDDGNRVASEFHDVEKLRPTETIRFIELAEVRSGADKIQYRIAKDQADADSGHSKLINFQHIYPKPRRWPSFFGFRSKKIVYEGKNTMMGPVRNRAWVNGGEPQW